MRRALATVEPSILDFSTFSGGLNLRASPENIAENELADCVNMTYSSQPGKLRTRDGIGEPIAEYSKRVQGMYWFGGKLLAATLDKKLHHVNHGLLDPDEIGTLTGDWRPMWCEFGGKLYIASHGKLQEYDGSTLSTISDSPNADVVYARAGRLFCSYHGDDTLHGSAVGDALTWTIPLNPTDSDPVEIQIGYKVAGAITAIIPALTDVIVFKEKGIFRLIGEYPDWTIKEVTRDESVANHHCVVNVAGFVYYLDDYKGMRILQGTQGYEEIAPGDALQKVNPWIRARMSHDYSGIWHLPARNMLVVIPNDNDGDEAMPCYYEFGFDVMPALIWKFPGAVQAIVEPDRDSLYIAVDNSVYDFSGSSAYDPTGDDGDLELVQSSFSTKLYRGFTAYNIKRASIRAETTISNVLTNTPMRVLVNDVPYMSILFNEDISDAIYGNENQVYLNDGELVVVYKEYADFAKHNLLRQRTVQFHFQNSGAPFELTRFQVELYPVGVTA